MIDTRDKRSSSRALPTSMTLSTHGPLPTSVDLVKEQGRCDGDEGSYKINAIVHCNHRLLECSRLGKGQHFKRPRMRIRRHEKWNLAKGKGITQNAEKVLVFHTFPIKIPMELTHTVVEGWDGGEKRNCKVF